MSDSVFWHARAFCAYANMHPANEHVANRRTRGINIGPSQHERGVSWQCQVPIKLKLNIQSFNRMPDIALFAFLRLVLLRYWTTLIDPTLFALRAFTKLFFGNKQY